MVTVYPYLVSLVWMAWAVLAAMQIAPQLLGEVYILDLLSHFRVHLAWLSLGLIPLFWWLKRAWAVVLVILLSVWNLLDIMPVYVSPPQQSVAVGQPLKLLLSNMLYSNTDTSRLEALIRQQNPDIVLIQELNQAHLELMAKLPVYRYQQHDLFKGAFGIGLWSRLPLAHSEVIALGPAGLPSIYARLNWGGQPLHLLSSHPLPPLNPQAFALRNQQFEAISEFLASKSGSMAVIGDLNVTPWSLHFRRFEASTGLRNARNGIGILPSWPTELPWLLRIPLDHALLSPGLIVKELRLGPDLGSDHLPLLITFSRVR
ncbi:MAG: hypothetical protein CVV27_07025 [Candidatus Melainabacteria bacterium HGW-Melainabacteria-1]|nr:MAG: hypothetical protein CVV27_07025 [Candidatus Melainabacteria bacterium HGW-Melainabacteria-1]